MVLRTAHWMRSAPVMGGSASLLLLLLLEDDASVPGSTISAFSARTAEASRKTEQIALQIIFGLPTGKVMQIGALCARHSILPSKLFAFRQLLLKQMVPDGGLIPAGKRRLTIYGHYSVAARMAATRLNPISLDQHAGLAQYPRTHPGKHHRALRGSGHLWD